MLARRIHLVGNASGRHIQIIEPTKVGRNIIDKTAGLGDAVAERDRARDDGVELLWAVINNESELPFGVSVAVQAVPPMPPMLTVHPPVQSSVAYAGTGRSNKAAINPPRTFFQDRCAGKGI